MNILLHSSNLLILAAGLTVVIIVAEFDLSIAALEALTGAVAAVLIVQYGVPLWLGIPATLAAGALAGLISGLAIAKLAIPSFVATLAMLGIAQGGAFLITGGDAILGFPDPFPELGQGRIYDIPIAFLLAVAVLIVVQLFLTRTRTGRHMFAVGGSLDAATLAGIRVGRIKATALVMSGTLSAIAGLILASRLNSGDGRNGSADLLNVIAAVVIGGTSLFGGAGSMLGTAAGVILVASIYNGMILLNVGLYWNQVVLGVIILAAVIIDQMVTGSGPMGRALARMLSSGRDVLRPRA